MKSIFYKFILSLFIFNIKGVLAIAVTWQFEKNINIGPFTVAAISEDGNKLATYLKNDDFVKIWDISKQKLMQKIKVKDKESAEVISLDINSKNDLLAIGFVSFPECPYKVIRLTTGKEIYLQDIEYTTTTLSVKISRDGEFFVAQTEETMRVWDLSNGKIISKLKFDTEFYPTFSISSDGSKLAYWIYEDKIINILDVKTGSIIAEFPCYGSVVGPSLLFNSDGTQLCIVGREKFLYDIKAKKVNRIFDEIQRDQDFFTLVLKTIASLGPYEAALSFDDKYLVTANSSEIIIWSTETGEPVQRIFFDFSFKKDIKKNILKGIAFTKDKRIIAVWNNGEIKIWSFKE